MNLMLGQHTLPEMTVDLFLGRYPRFVYGLDRGRAEAPPVLCGHGVEPQAFERLLRFLSQNSYETLDCRSYYEHVMGIRAAPRRSVLLTFDDGVGSMWSVAFPLLKKYGHRAVVFLIAGRMREGVPGTNLEDVWGGRAAEQEALLRDVGGEPLLTWEEARHMHESGLVDFQSHSLRHNLVITAPSVIGFVTPGFLATAHPHDLSMYDIDPEDRSYAVPRAGAPLYPVASRLSDHLSFRENIELRKALEDRVAEEGEGAFFARTNWVEGLREIVRQHETRAAPGVESPDQRDAAIREELFESKRLIELHLPGKRVEHLALPWGMGGERVVAVSRDAGYLSCFWGKVDGRLRNRSGSDPFRIARVGSDFSMLLPGRGRSNLPFILWRKARRRWLASRSSALPRT